MTATIRPPRIKVPADVVRTAERIMADVKRDGLTVRRMTDGSDCVFLTCWNCGGSGDYPSSMIPAGRCRLYCWQNRTPDTFGKLPVSVAKYIKREQASDRREYREKIRYELDAPARAERERAAVERQAAIDAENAERERAEAERLAISHHVGAIGERITLPVSIVNVHGFDSAFGRRSIYRLRDDAGNVLTWFTGGVLDAPKGQRVEITATVKSHDEYKGERQTVIERARLAKPARGAR